MPNKCVFVWGWKARHGNQNKIGDDDCASNNNCCISCKRIHVIQSNVEPIIRTHCWESSTSSVVFAHTCIHCHRLRHRAYMGHTNLDVHRFCIMMMLNEMMWLVHVCGGAQFHLEFMCNSRMRSPHCHWIADIGNKRRNRQKKHTRERKLPEKSIQYRIIVSFWPARRPSEVSECEAFGLLFGFVNHKWIDNCCKYSVHFNVFCLP